VDDDALLRAFESCTLPAERWCHRLHVRLAYAFLRRDDFDAALARFRERLRAYNRSIGIRDTATSGYHETLTVAWFHLVADRARTVPRSLDSDAFCTAHPALLDKTMPRRFYSRERISSERARRGFVAPDLRPLPARPRAEADPGLSPGPGAAR
jgi:hypothetical protein